MSRGLGKNQEKILNYLKNKTKTIELFFEDRKDKYKIGKVGFTNEVPIKELVCHVFDRDLQNNPPTETEYKSVNNSIKRLKMKNLVITKKITTKTAQKEYHKKFLEETNTNWITVVKITNKVLKTIPLRLSIVRSEYTFHPFSKQPKR